MPYTATEIQRAKRVVLALKRKTMAAGCPLAEVETAQATIIEIERKYSLKNISYQDSISHEQLKATYDRVMRETEEIKSNYKSSFGDFEMLAKLSGFLYQDSSENYREWAKITPDFGHQGLKVIHLQKSGVYSWELFARHGSSHVTIKTGQGGPSLKTYLWEMEN